MIENATDQKVFEALVQSCLSQGQVLNNYAAQIYNKAIDDAIANYNQTKVKTPLPTVPRALQVVVNANDVQTLVSADPVCLARNYPDDPPPITVNKFVLGEQYDEGPPAKWMIGENDTVPLGSRATNTSGTYVKVGKATPFGMMSHYEKVG